jgi:rhodanese-related sulfurtransferase
VQPAAAQVEPQAEAPARRAIPRPALTVEPADPYAEAKENLATQQAILLDVREMAEWDSGHIDGAIIFPLSWLEEFGGGARPNTIPDDKIVYVYGRSAANANAAADVLNDMGFDARPFEHGLVELAGRFESQR